MPAGRPVKFKTPEEMQVVIDQYFEELKLSMTKDGVMIEYPTITGLALALGFNSRQSLLNYEGNPEFLDTIKRAKLRVESFIEQRLYSGQATGCIFNLKNNFDWKDKTETELSNPEGRPFETRNVDDATIDKRIAELLNKTGKARASATAGRKKK